MAPSAKQLLADVVAKSENISKRFVETYGDSKGKVQAQFERMEELLDSFCTAFGPDEPVEVHRAPGRVNLIGEHTDYNGLPVLPIALDRDILCAVSPRNDGKCLVRNIDPRFPEFDFPAYQAPTRLGIGHWGNYVLAAQYGLYEEGATHGIDVGEFSGANMLYCGNVPTAAGLSSSSALVVVSALALLGVHDKWIEEPDLAQLLSRAEHFVGTQGGGMDQTISLLGHKDHALKIDFRPFGFESVPMPSTVRIVVSNSLVSAAKTGEARYAYNRRVIECRIAVAFLNQALQQEMAGIRELCLLGDYTFETLGLVNAKLDEIADRAIPKSHLTQSEAASRLSLEEQDFRERFCQLSTGEILETPPDGFKVWNRYRHVVTEGRRVEEAVRNLEKGETKEFGRLMNASHASCRDHYEISCEVLDKLVETSRQAGALGARLTGAGFGGCAVSLVVAEHAPDFTKSLREVYYDQYLATEHPKFYANISDINSVVFVVRPAEGAGKLLP